MRRIRRNAPVFSLRVHTSITFRNHIAALPQRTGTAFSLSAFSECGLRAFRFRGISYILIGFISKDGMRRLGIVRQRKARICVANTYKNTMISRRRISRCEATCRHPSRKGLRSGSRSTSTTGSREEQGRQALRPARWPALCQRPHPHRPRLQQGAEGLREQKPCPARVFHPVRSGLGLPRPAYRSIWSRSPWALIR